MKFHELGEPPFLSNHVVILPRRYVISLLFVCLDQVPIIIVTHTKKLFFQGKEKKRLKWRKTCSLWLWLSFWLAPSSLQRSLRASALMMVYWWSTPRVRCCLPTFPAFAFPHEVGRSVELSYRTTYHRVRLAPARTARWCGAMCHTPWWTVSPASCLCRSESNFAGS